MRNTPLENSRSRPSAHPMERRGFALVVALTLMSFIVLLLLSMSMLTRVELSTAVVNEYENVARENALFGLKVALGQLQREMGPDQRISAPASILDANPATLSIDGVAHPYWTGAWNGQDWGRDSLTSPMGEDGGTGKPNSFRSWLVSGTDAQIAAHQFAVSSGLASDDLVSLYNQSDLGNANDPELQIQAPRVSYAGDGMKENAYAYWIGDEGIKVQVSPEEEVNPTSQAARTQKTTDIGNPNFNLISDWEALPADFGQDQNLGFTNMLKLALLDADPSNTMWSGKFDDVTGFSRLLLTDTRDGGLRKDLSLLFSMDNLPTGYRNEPLFEYGTAQTADWNALKRYHNRYMQLSTQNGAPTLNILDVRDESLDSLAPYKQGDNPMPFFVRFQYLFSMYKGPRTTSLTNDVSDGPETADMTPAGIPQNLQSVDPIVYMMVHPVFYLWNPYNVTFEMPADNLASLTFKTTFPTMEFSFDGGSHYKPWSEIFWEWAGTLIALEMPNRSGGQSIIIPPGEMRVLALGEQFNRVENRLYLFWEDKDAIYGTASRGEGSRNQPLVKGFNEGVLGLFSPDLRGGDVNGYSQPSNVLPATGNLQINARFNTTATGMITKNNLGTESSGQIQNVGVYQVDATTPLEDTFFQTEYESSSFAAANLPTVLDGAGSFTGMQPLFVMDYSLRAFLDDPYPGKLGLFADLDNRYYYSDSATDVDLATAPFALSFKEIESLDDYQRFDPTTGKAFFQHGSDIVFSVIADEIPTAPMVSLAQLQHGPFGRDVTHPALQFDSHIGSDVFSGGVTSASYPKRDMAPQFNRPIGNAFAHPELPVNRIGDGAYGLDLPFVLNDTLFDGYFFSGIANQSGPLSGDDRTAAAYLSDILDGNDELPNSRYALTLPADETAEERRDALLLNGDTLRDQAFERIAAYIQVEGGFNVNSTSVEAWKALLGGLRDREILHTNTPDATEDTTIQSDLVTEGAIVLSNSLPGATAAESVSQTEMISTLWNGFRALSDHQIGLLAEAMVEEVKARGPFRSISEFVNREVSNRSGYNQYGALQSAINAARINLESDEPRIDRALESQYDSYPNDAVTLGGFTPAPVNPEALQGDKSEGMPGYIMQADLLRPLAPIIAARSDTFVIRAYGEVSRFGERKATAICEAVVQRKIDYIEPDEVSGARLEPWDVPSESTHPINYQYGRRFEIVEFRWLDTDS